MTRRSLASSEMLPRHLELLPLRLHRLPSDRYVATNLVGEWLILEAREADAVARDDWGALSPGTIEAMRSRHMVRDAGEHLPLELLAMKLRTRKRRLADLTALHMFVVTLRCEHTCRYCQVSRKASLHDEFDMTQETAEAALQLVFCSPSPQIKIEFQGGESLLNFELIRWIVERAVEMNVHHRRELAFVIATNLVLIDDEMLSFCQQHGVVLSTSLDGPRELHNKNRRRPGQDSWERATSGIRRVLDRLGPDYVSALMTTTELSLDQPEQIIDTYVELGLSSVFLRPISPYGFANRLRGGGRYGAAEWLSFYRRGLDHVIELNRRGTPIVELFASIVAKKMFSNDDPGYIDLTSPAGIGIGGIVYNYDGGVYASDEGRMLAEMGDQTFRLGTVSDSYRDLLTSPKLLAPLWESFTLSVPKCDLCAFEPYCGSDPSYHHATAGDFAGHKTFSDFCERNTGIYEYLLTIIEHDSFTRELLFEWAHS